MLFTILFNRWIWGIGLGILAGYTLLNIGWNSLMFIIPGVLAIVFLGGKLFGQSGAVYREIHHRPEHDNPNGVVYWDEGDNRYINKDGRTYLLTDPAPPSSKNDWANTHAYNNRPKPTRVKARVTKSKWYKVDYNQYCEDE